MSLEPFCHCEERDSLACHCEGRPFLSLRGTESRSNPLIGSEQAPQSLKVTNLPSPLKGEG
jgi:hypothetical protein